jgi:hypothetical protein
VIQSQSLRVLGLAAGASEADIRRAYAQRLKTTHPEDDPEGFKELRAAYETALEEARYRAHRTAVESVDEEEAGEEDEEEDESVDAEPAASAPEVEAAAEPEAESVASPVREEDLHAEACNRFVAALQGGGNADDINAALDAVLTSSALDNIHTYNRTEIWLARVLTSAGPASYPVLDRIISYFRWDQQTDHRNWAAGAVLDLRRRIPLERASTQFLQRVRDRRHEFHRAYMETTRAPSTRSFLSRAWSLRNHNLVDRFLAHVDTRAPLAMQELNAEAVHWWRTRKRGIAGAIVQASSIARSIGFLLVLVAGGLYLYSISDLSFGERKASAPLGPSVAEYIDMLEKQRTNKPDRIVVSPPPKPAPPRMVLTPEGRRIKARAECDTAMEAIKTAYAAQDLGKATARADARCRRELEIAPDSLVLTQHVAVLLLLANKPDDAKTQFDAILALSPNDPYALYGREVAVLMAGGAPDMGTMTEAVKRDPAVEQFYADYYIGAPEVGFMETEPESRWKKRPRPQTDTGMKQISAISDEEMLKLLVHFGVQRTPPGEAVLECLANADGSVTDCVILKETPYNKGVGEFAIRSAMAAKFEPAKLDGVAVDKAPFQYTITLTNEERPDADKDGADKDDADKSEVGADKNEGEADKSEANADKTETHAGKADTQ